MFEQKRSEHQLRKSHNQEGNSTFQLLENLSSKKMQGPFLKKNMYSSNIPNFQTQLK
jgi:hypothetical protein